MKVRVRLFFLSCFLWDVVFFARPSRSVSSFRAVAPPAPAHWETPSTSVGVRLCRTPVVLLCYLERKLALQSAAASMPADPHGSVRPSVCLNSNPCDDHDSGVCLAISLQILLPFSADASL